MKHHQRLRRFARLVHEWFYVPSEVLIATMKTTRKDRFNRLTRLACLRVLVAREHGIGQPSGLPYLGRKRAVRAALGV